MALSLKHAKFVAEYLKDFNGTQAAIRSGYSAKTARVAGSRLLAVVAISEAIHDARKSALGDAKLSLADHVAMLSELRDKAATAEQYSAAVAAETNRGKASGLYIDRTELSGNPDRPVIVQEWVFGGKRVAF